MTFVYAFIAMVWAAALSAAEMDIVFLSAEPEDIATLSNLDPIPENIGVAGFQLAISDNRTTGKFLDQTFRDHHIVIPLGDDPTPYFDEALSLSPYVVTDLPMPLLLQLSDRPAAQGALIFNASAQEAALRTDQCKSNLFHTIPSYSMRSDALRRSFSKFGLKLRSEKQWDATADIRRTAASEIPIFTQDLNDHDVLIIADEVDDFGRYVPFNTWLARPVAGSQGLRPIGWDRTAEQWGAAQLQSRFAKDFDRHMYSRDYAAWAAVRSLGEAMTRTGLSDPKVIRDYILSDDFELAAFKGRALSYRSWNGQLRQPIPVVGPTAVVANAPLDGFLHQRNELDTLGLDQGESACKAFER